jgi:hypothetical protein
MITMLGREEGSMMAENDGLGADKESHPGLLTLMERLVTFRRRVLLTFHGQLPQPMENHSQV